MEDVDNVRDPREPTPDSVRASQHRLAANTEAPRRARRLASRIARNLPIDVADRAVLVTSELVTNAVRHGSGTEGVVSLDLCTQGDSLTVSVADDGRKTAQSPSQGFGLMIMRKLADRWKIERHPHWRVTATFLPRTRASAS